MASFEEIIGALDKESKDLLKFGSDVVMERVQGPSVGITMALGGGIVRGSQVMVWGPKSAGKTTFCLQQIAQAQKEGLVCAFLDVEGTFDPEWARRLGVDTDHLLYYTPRTTAAFADRAVKLHDAGVDVLVLDSVTALMPAAFTEKDGEIKDFANSRQIGSLARDMSQVMSMVNGANEDRSMTVIVISQSRNGPKGGMYWGMNATGGEGLRFYSSTIIKLNSSTSQSNTILGEVRAGNLVLEKPIGRIVKWEVELNKTGAQGYTGEYNLMFEGDEVGIDNKAEAFDYGVKGGIIERAGAWFSMNGEKLGQGKDKALAALKADPEKLEKVKESIYGGGTDSLEQTSFTDEEDSAA